jgi:hypothetical protein
MTDAWQPVAEDTRRALGLLGYPVPDCFPGKPEACGGSFLQHAAANMGVLRAVVEYHITHLGDAAEISDTVYADTLVQLLAEDAADPRGEHPPAPRYNCVHQASNFTPCTRCGHERTGDAGGQA